MNRSPQDHYPPQETGLRPPGEEQAGGPGLPFEPLTILIGLMRRWKFLVGVLLLSLILGLGGALKFGTHTYEAKTVILFKGKEAKDIPEDVPGLYLPLSTQIHMVKIPSNLEAVREALKLPTTLRSLGQACRVDVEKKTSLVTITARWNSAKTVTDIVTTLREVFMANQMVLSKENAQRELQVLEEQFIKVEAGLRKEDAALQKFISENKIVDLGREIQWNLEQLTSLQLLLSNAQVDRETLQAQRAVIEERVTTVKGKAQEEKSVAAQNQSLADLNIRIERLRRAIHDNKVQRENEVDLVKYRSGFERSKELFEKGLISKEEFEQAQADFERQEVKTVDTAQIAEWKRQLKILEQEVVPPKEDFKSPTQEFLQGLLLKVLDMDLQILSLRLKVTHLTEEMTRVRGRLMVLTDLQRQHAALTREVTAREAEKMDMEKNLSKARQAVESNISDFLLISEASVPLFSIGSNRKMILGVVVALGFMLGLTLVLALELLDTSVKSAAEIQHRFSLPVIGVVPTVKNAQEAFPDATHFAMIERFRIISRRLRRDIPMHGARILITSADQWEGKTLVTANLAACLGRQDERVLVMDAQLRSEQGSRDLRYLIAERDQPLKGLGAYLTFEADTVDEVIWPTVLPGVECIPRMEESAVPDLLVSHRMRELVEGLSERFSLILIDGPPVGEFVDAELVGQWCDAVIFVVRSRVCPSSLLKKAVDRIRTLGIPVIRFVINDVDRLYINRA